MHSGSSSSHSQFWFYWFLESVQFLPVWFGTVWLTIFRCGYDLSCPDQEPTIERRPPLDALAATLKLTSAGSEALPPIVVPHGSGFGKHIFLGDSPVRLSDATPPQRASCNLPAIAGSHAGCIALLSKVILDLVV